MGTLAENGWYFLAAGNIIILFSIIHAIVLKYRKEEVKPFHWICLVLFALVIAVIYQVTVSPEFGFHWEIRMQEVNLKPLQVLKHRNVNQLNFYGNIIMFIPVGVLTVWLSRDYGKIYKAVLFGTLISCSIEGIQLFLSRGTDIDDVILNTLGTLIGACVAKLLAAMIPVIKRSIGIRKLGMNRLRRKDGGYLPILTLGILGSVLLCGVIKRNDLFMSNEWNMGKKSRPAYQAEGLLAESTVQPEDSDVENCSEASSILDNVESNQGSTIKPLDLEAGNVYFFNASTGTMLYGSGYDQRIAPASTTKMLTALTAMDYCDMNDLVTVGDEINEVTRDASKAGLWKGMQMDFSSMLAALLLPSGNDAAYSIAAHTGRKIAGDETMSQTEAVRVFVQQMNEKASELGALDSHFVRPDGYDAEEQYTTAQDLGRIALEFMECGPLRQISGSERIRCISQDGMDITYSNTDELVCTDSSFYTKEVIGGKTGSSGKAGKCLVSAAMIQDQMYIAVVMGDTEEGRFQDSIQLYNAVK